MIWFHDSISTENAMFKLTELILRAWNNRGLVTGLFCGLTKAFDCVNHELLIQKLGFYGIKGCILNWREPYLCNRKQRVVLQFANSYKFLSSWETIRHGVPQGSVLGLLLFNVYINDLPCIINKFAHTILFADDTNIYVSYNGHNELNSKLHSVMNCISKWFQNNQLVLNLSKTRMVKFNSSKSITYPLHFAYNNQAVNTTETVKFLGMHVDCYLTWKIAY
jgi:hypothetical protein